MPKVVTAAKLISQRVATGKADEKLADIVRQVARLGAHHCVVLDEANHSFVGVIRLADLTGRSEPGRRILGDLVAKATPPFFAETAAAHAVVDRFEKEYLSEAVVFASDGSYLGLITAESVLAWSRNEFREAEAIIRRSEEHLRKTQGELQSALLAKDNFIATLSHELRTPLNPVLLISRERAAQMGLAPDVRSDFQTIANNAMMEARLVDDLLDLTRIAHGKMLIKLESLSLRGVVGEVLAKMKPVLEGKNLRLEEQWGAADFVIRGDPVRLQQVFCNILQNAAKFTGNGGEVGIAIRPTKIPGHVEIVFSDTGIGMSPEEINRAFDPFQQGAHGGNGTSSKFGGLGLGLAIAKGVVELHQGTIAAASGGLNEGSIVTVILPALKEEMIVAAIAPGNSAGQPAFAEERLILLVEDHEASRSALARILQRRGYTAITAGSLAEAIAHAQKHPFSAVISDIGLPDGSGYELMSTLRERFGLKGVATSGYGASADVARSKAAGFRYHLTKPINLTELESALSEIFS